MEIFENNIEKLKKYMPKFYGRMENWLESFVFNDDCGIEFVPARDGSLYMQYNKEGRIIRLNSSYNPEREAIQWAEQYNYNGYRNVVIMFGIGSMHFIKALLGRLKANHTLVIYEPDKNVFYKILNEIDMTDLIEDNRTELVVGEEELNTLFSIVATLVPWANIEGLSIVRHPEYENVFVEEHSRFVDTLNRVVSAIKVEGNTEAYFGKDMAYNIVNNIKHIPYSHYLSEFIGKFDENTIGIVVAAGPSLDRNVHILHDIKEKAIIMATDTSLKRLHDEGIVPDFVVSVDPKKPIRLFENVSFEKIPFMCRLDCNCKVLSLHTGHKIWVNPLEFFAQLYAKIDMEVDVENSGGSVATMAFSLCNMLGLNNIVLIGQDLAYDGESTHAGGIEDHIINEDKTITYVKGNNGDMVKTRGDWKIYLEWYERVIKLLPEETRVINATEGGAYIEGTEIMTLREVADTLCTKQLHITDKINSILERTHEDYNDKIAEFFDNCVSDIKVMIKSLEKGITLCNRFERKYKRSKSLTSEVINCMNDIGKVNKRVGEMPIYLIVDEIVKHEDKNSIKNIYGSDEDEYTSNLNMISNTKRIFELSLKAVKDIQEDFVNNVQEVKRRIENGK